jgi:hypothetical protein
MKWEIEGVPKEEASGPIIYRPKGATSSTGIRVRFFFLSYFILFF